MKTHSIYLILIFFSSIFLIFACDEKTDQPTNDEKWDMKLFNSTNKTLKILLIDTSKYPDNMEFTIQSNQEMVIFKGASGLSTLDPISRLVYDSALVYFENDSLLIYTKLDTKPNNILYPETYKIKNTVDNRIQKVHTITQNDLNFGDKIK